MAALQTQTVPVTPTVSAPVSTAKPLRVLLVEPARASTQGNLGTFLPAGACQLDRVGDEMAAVGKLRSGTYDVILWALDNNGNNKSRLESHIRTFKNTCRLPLLVVTRSTDMKTCVAALDGGADCILLPLSSEVLMEKIRTVMKSEAQQNHAVSITDRLHINFRQAKLLCNNRPIKLTAQQYAILQALALQRGEWVRFEKLAELAGSSGEWTNNLMQVQLGKIRRKIDRAHGAGWGKRVLHTEYGRFGIRMATAEELSGPA